MVQRQHTHFDRRHFLSAAAVLVASPFLGAPPANAAQPAPETTKLRFLDDPSICFAPQYLAMELLRQ